MRADGLHRAAARGDVEDSRIQSLKFYWPMANFGPCWSDAPRNSSQSLSQAVSRLLREQSAEVGADSVRKAEHASPGLVPTSQSQ